MKRLMILTALLLAACGASEPTVTASMKASMEAYADQVDGWYPNIDQNVARECAENPTFLYWSDELRAYAVTCPLSLNENSYGIVTLDEHEEVLNAFSIGAASQGEVTRTLALLGWELVR